MIYNIQVSQSVRKGDIYRVAMFQKKIPIKDIEYFDILTGKNMLSIEVANIWTSFICQFVHPVGGCGLM